MRIMQRVHWQGKNYDLPFKVNLEWGKGQEVEIRNRFSGEPCKLPWFAAAVYDLIMGSERFEDWKTHREGFTAGSPAVWSGSPFCISGLKPTGGCRARWNRNETSR